MKKTIFKGCGTAIVTPFDEFGVNYSEFERLINDQITAGVDAIIVCGTTGESATMTNEEKRKTIKFAIDVINKRVPVIIGTGSNCTKSAIELSVYAESVGADGLLLVTPYYNKTTQAGLVAHYKAIAESVHIPIILYNVPSRTGMNILPSTCLELSKIDNIVAIKEASGDLEQIKEIISLCKDDLKVYSGNDDQIVPILRLGGIGVISVLSNVLPSKTKDMTQSYFNGDVTRAEKLQEETMPLIKALFCEVNPIPVKAALNMIGYKVGIPRLPLIEASDEAKEKLKDSLQSYFNI